MWFLHLSHPLLTQVQIILQVQEHGTYSIMFHLTALFVVCSSNYGTADWIYQADQLQK
jgi:hypothetical protein